MGSLCCEGCEIVSKEFRGEAFEIDGLVATKKDKQPV
jgi:hypothetical protein